MYIKLVSFAALVLLSGAAMAPTGVAGGHKNGAAKATNRVITDEFLVGISLPSKSAAVAPEQAGKIIAIPAAEGQVVAQNDVLFRLSDRLEQLEVERLRALADSDVPQRRAAAALQYAERQQQRVRELRAKDISSDSDLQTQDLEVAMARLKVEQVDTEQKQVGNELAKASERLSQRTILAPFHGIVTQRWKSEGEAVEKFVPVVEVMCLDPLWIEFDCPVLDKDVFRVGASIEVAPALAPSDVRTATVSLVSVKATAASHSFMVRAAVPNPTLDWKAGQKMSIRRPSSTNQGKPETGK